MSQPFALGYEFVRFCQLLFQLVELLDTALQLYCAALCGFCHIAAKKLPHLCCQCLFQLLRLCFCGRSFSAALFCEAPRLFKLLFQLFQLRLCRGIGAFFRRDRVLTGAAHRAGLAVTELLCKNTCTVIKKGSVALLVSGCKSARLFCGFAVQLRRLLVFAAALLALGYIRRQLSQLSTSAFQILLAAQELLFLRTAALKLAAALFQLRYLFRQQLALLYQSVMLEALLLQLGGCPFQLVAAVFVFCYLLRQLVQLVAASAQLLALRVQLRLVLACAAES